MSRERDFWKEFWLQQSREAKTEARGYDPVQEECDVVVFESKSNGRGRKPRRHPREITLVRFRSSGRTWEVKDVPNDGIDVKAREILGDSIPSDADPFQVFLERILAIAREGL